MNKFFIYARPCINEDFFFMMACSAVFFVSFPKYSKMDGNDEKLSSVFLATQTNRKSGEDVSQIIIKPE